MEPRVDRSSTTRAILLLFLGSLLSVSSVAGQASQTKTLVLSYGEFGPQAAAYKLIGFQWYQWNSHGDSDPNSVDDINVVVYQGVSMSRLKKMFPVSRETKTDYRYLKYRDALKYLDRHRDTAGLEHLRDTRKKIIRVMGTKR